MAQGSKGGDSSGELEDGKGDANRPRRKFLPPNAACFLSLTYFSLTAFLIVAVAALLQAQLTSLREELAALKANLSSQAGCGQERARILRKRSPEPRNKARRGSDIKSALLQGSLPFQHIEKQGKVGPWLLSSTDHPFVRLRAKGTEVEISESGIYYVYAQVHYLTSQSHNSYQILSYNGTEERKNHRNVATCSSHGRDSMGEVSCYTGLVVSMSGGQRLYLNQVEQDRIIHFTNGSSYFGVVLLKRNKTKRER